MATPVGLSVAGSLFKGHVRRADGNRKIWGLTVDWIAHLEVGEDGWVSEVHREVLSQKCLGLGRGRGKADECGRGNLLVLTRRRPGCLDIC